MSQVEVHRQSPNVQPPSLLGAGHFLDFLETNHRHPELSMQPDATLVQVHQLSEGHLNNPIPIDSLPYNPIPQIQHHRIRELHGDHHPLYIAPPPAHFFPPFSQIQSTAAFPTPDTQLAPIAPPLVRSLSDAELTTSSPNLGHQPKKLKSVSTIRNRRKLVQPPQSATPVLATSSNPVTPTVSDTEAPLATSEAPLKAKRGRKPKDPIVHAAKREAKEKRKSGKEAVTMAESGPQPPSQPTQQIVFVVEEVGPNPPLPHPPTPPPPPPPPSSLPKEPDSRPSTSGMSQGESSTPLRPSFSTPYENKKRSADSAFSTDITSWLANEGSIDVDASWTVSSPMSSPITSPETGGLRIFLQAPPSTPIDEILSTSAQLGINPALLLQEDVFHPLELGKSIRTLNLPLEILDEYSIHPQSPIGATSPNRQTSPSEDNGGKKIGLMDLMLLRNDSEEKPSSKKKPRPNLVFSTTKRGKAVVSLQNNASKDHVEPTTPIRERPLFSPETDLRSLVLKRRQEVWGDEVGTEVTRITVHRRLTARKTSTGLMSPLSPNSSAKYSDIIESDSDSSDSSDDEDDTEEMRSGSQATPLATPTHPLLSGQNMQKSFSAPALSHLASEDIFLPSTPQPEQDEYAILSARADPKPFEGDSGMRCKTCGMLFRKHSVLSSHERTCMAKQTPFIPYDFLRADADDGFSFSGGRQLFNDDVDLTPRNLAAHMEYESPLMQKGDIKRLQPAGFVEPGDTVSSDENENNVPPKEPGMISDESIVGQPRGQTRCICKRPEKAVAGVMVQCGKCEYWLHTRCLKVKARDLPDIWFCPACVE